MADVFVSYKKVDRDRLSQLITGLEDEGFTVWWDFEVETGDDWFDAVLREIDLARAVVGVWSRESVGRDARFVANEQGMQYVRLEHRRAPAKLAPVLLDPDRVPAEFMDVQAADLSDWDGSAADPEWQKLVARIELLATPARVRSRIERMVADLEEKDRIQESLAAKLASAVDSAEKTTTERLEATARIELLVDQMAEKDELLAEREADLAEEREAHRQSNARVRTLDTLLKDARAALSESAAPERGAGRVGPRNRLTLEPPTPRQAFAFLPDLLVWVSLAGLGGAALFRQWGASLNGASYVASDVGTAAQALGALALAPGVALGLATMSSARALDLGRFVAVVIGSQLGAWILGGAVGLVLTSIGVAIELPAASMPLLGAIGGVLLAILFGLGFRGVASED